MHKNDFFKTIPKYWEMMQVLFKLAKDKRDLLIDMYAIVLLLACHVRAVHN